MPDQVSVIVPARNEAATIGRVVEILLATPGMAEVVVVDNGSLDDTALIAAAAGARTVFEARPGMGNALRAGIHAASHDWVMKVDADLDKFDVSLFQRLPDARAPGVGLIKGVWQDPQDNMPMTRLLVTPAINRMFPGLSHLRAPNSGIYLFNRALIAHAELTGDYSADLDVMLRVHAAGAAVTEVDIGRIEHDPRSLQHYNDMAETILVFFMRQNEARITRETIVLAQGAGQVISTCLGVLAARSIAGAAVTVCLAEPGTDAADALREALAPFPTALVQPLVQAGRFRPHTHASDLNFIAPYPVAGEDKPISVALDLLHRFPLPGEADLMLMPPDRGAVGGFHADIALEIGAGAGIKQAALGRIREEVPTVPSPREMFQSYRSLPEALTTALGSQSARHGAGNI